MRIAPGPVQTRWLADHQDMVEEAMKHTPLKRPATADDIADATLFLAGGSSLITGQVIVVDGGRTGLNLFREVALLHKTSPSNLPHAPSPSHAPISEGGPDKRSRTPCKAGHGWPL